MPVIEVAVPPAGPSGATPRAWGARSALAALPRLLVATVLLLAAALSVRNITDLDFGQHLATGRWILEHRAVPSTDPFSWTYPDHAYVAYHWLFQVLLALADRLAGAAGAVVLRAALIFATVAVLADDLRRRGVSPLVGAALGLLGLLASEWRFALRPELFSLLGLAATAWVLRDRRPLWLLAPIQLVWVNTHVFVLGWALVLAAAAQDALRGRFDRRWRNALLASGAAVFLNPYGWKGVVYPLVLLARLSGDDTFGQEISELASPFSLGSDPRFPWGIGLQLGCWKLLLLGALLAVPFLLRSRRWANLAVLLAFAGLSASAVRNLPLFVVVALPLIGEAATRWRSPGLERWLAPILLVVASVLALRVADGAFYAAGRRPVRMRADVDATQLAVQTADFLERYGLNERGFNNLDVGGALLWRHPSGEVFIDGRNEVSGEAFFRRYLALSSPDGWPRLAPSWGFEYVALGHRTAPRLAGVLLADPTWRLVHFDAVALVLVRVGGRYDALPSATLPAPVSDDERRRALDAVRADVGTSARLGRWLLGSELAPAEAHFVGTFLLMTGQRAAAERPLLEAARLSPNHYETSNNLGALYWRMERWEDAARCYRNVLLLEPGNELARRRLREAEGKGRGR